MSGMFALVDPGVSKWGHMESTEREPTTGSRGLCFGGVQMPLVRGKGARPP